MQFWKPKKTLPTKPPIDTITDTKNSLRRYKLLFWATMILFVIMTIFSLLEFFVIQDMARDMRNQVSINNDLEIIATSCMQSNFTNLGDSQ